MVNFDTVIRGGRLATASEVFDADLGIVDGRIAAVGRNLAAGTIEITGWPETVLSRGEVVVDRGRFTATAGRGQFLPCDTPAAARPKYDANRETLRCPT